MSLKNGDDSSSCSIKDQVAITPLPELGEGVFRNAHPLWHPPGARGVFGGIAISQSLNTAQAMVPGAFHVHSMHTSFLQAGTSETPIIYHVSELRRSRNFITKTVQAVQNDRALAVSAVSFTRNSVGKSSDDASNDDGKGPIRHAEPMPKNIPSPYEWYSSDEQVKTIPNAEGHVSIGPFLNWSLGCVDSSSSGSGPQSPHQKRIHQWIKARGHLDSPSTGMNHHTHVAALAYMSDSYCIASIPHVNGIYDFVHAPLTEYLVHESTKQGNKNIKYTSIHRPYLQQGQKTQPDYPFASSAATRVDFMVTLDNTIYFHCPRGFRADEWLLAEVQSQWSGGGRGLATQKIWSHDGTLAATCIQEGLVRVHRGEQRVLRSVL